MRLVTDTKVRVDFADTVAPALQHLGVSIVTMSPDERTHTLNLVLRLPAGSDRSLRHKVLEKISDFEQDLDHATVSDVTFLWDDEEGKNPHTTITLTQCPECATLTPTTPPHHHINSWTHTTTPTPPPHVQTLTP